MSSDLDTPLAAETAVRLADLKPSLRIGSYADGAELLRRRGLAVAMHLGVGNEAYTACSVQTLDGEAHFRRRRLLAPIFGPEARRHYELDTLPPAFARAVARAAERAGGDWPIDVDLVVLIRETIVQITGRLIGLDGLDEGAVVRRLLELADKVVPPVSARWSLEGDTLIRDGLEARDAYIQEFVAPARERRRLLLAQAEAPDPPDLLTLLLRDGDPDDDVSWQSESIVALAASLGTTLQSTLRALSQIDGWVRDDPARESYLADLRFLRRASAESIRLHPVIPEMARVSLEEVVLEEGGPVIPPGTMIEVDPFETDRDPEVFSPDPDVFDPFRAVPSRARDFGLGFGGGAHMCTGQRMAVEHAQAVTDDPGDPVGIVPRLLLGLYRAGVELDPLHPPTLVDRNRQGKYASFPARLTRRGR